MTVKKAGAGARPRDFGPHQMADELGVLRGHVDRARELGLLPEPDVRGKRWSAVAVDEIRGRWPEVAAALEAAREFGTARCATLLAERTGLAVDYVDVEELAARGEIEATGDFKERPLYRVAAIEALAGQEDDVELLAAIVAERQVWMANSLDGWQAAARLGWTRSEFGAVVRQRGVRTGRFDRYAIADVDALAGEEDLAEEVRRRRTLGPDQAAAHLEIRRIDFDYCVAAGWITAAGHVDSHVSRGRWVSVALYCVADVEALLEIPGVDWEAVRSARAGDESVLREFARLPIARGVLVRGFAADLSARHGVAVSARYDDARDRWTLAWTVNAGGKPRAEDVRAALQEDRELAPHAGNVWLRASAAEGERNHERDHSL